MGHEHATVPADKRCHVVLVAARGRADALNRSPRPAVAADAREHAPEFVGECDDHVASRPDRRAHLLGLRAA
jgi:hypothetical protein